MILLHIPLILTSILHLSHIHINQCEANISKLKEVIEQNLHELKDWQTLFDVGEGNGDLLLKWSEKGNVVKVKELLEMHANISARNSHLWTPLHFAAYFGHLDVAQALLDAGANIEVQNIHKNTPLLWSVHKNHLDICRLLLDRGANINVTDFHKNTPLHIAAWYGYLPIVKLLVERGADVNAINKDDRTPEQLAEHEERWDVVTWLQKH